MVHNLVIARIHGGNNQASSCKLRCVLRRSLMSVCRRQKEEKKEKEKEQEQENEVKLSTGEMVDA